MCIVDDVVTATRFVLQSVEQCSSKGAKSLPREGDRGAIFCDLGAISGG